MSETLETVETTTDFAKGIARDLTVGTAQAAAGFVLALGVLGAIGYTVETVKNRRAKKAAVKLQVAE